MMSVANSPKNQTGVVLLMVLLIFAIVSVLATSMLESQAIDLQRSSGQFISQQARSYAYSSEQAVRQGLHEDWKQDNKIDHLQEEWTTERVFPLEPGTATIVIQDLQGRFNLNSLSKSSGIEKQQLQRFKNLLALLDIDSKVADDWKNWLDKSSQIESDYFALQPSYRPAYQACQHTSELMLLTNVDRPTYKKLEFFVSCLSPTSALNINTASELVLQSLDQDMTQAQVDAIVQARSGEGIKEVDDFLQIDELKEFTTADEESEENEQIPVKELWQASDFTVKTEYFELFTRIDLGGDIATMEAVLHRSSDNGVFETIYRDFSRREVRRNQVSVNDDTNQVGL